MTRVLIVGMMKPMSGMEHALLGDGEKLMLETTRLEETNEPLPCTRIINPSSASRVKGVPDGYFTYSEFVH